MKFISKDNAEAHPPIRNHEHETAGACVIIEEAIGFPEAAPQAAARTTQAGP